MTNSSKKRNSGMNRTASLFAAVLLFLCVLMQGSLTVFASYNDTNLNTFAHDMESIPVGEIGERFQIRFRFGYNGTQGLYNPASDYVEDVNVGLSNDQTYIGVQVEVGTKKSAFIERLENLLGEDIDAARAEEYYQGYLDGYNDTSKGTVLYNYPVDSGSYPFEVNGQIFTQRTHFDRLERGNYQEVVFEVNIRKDAKEGYYAIPIVFDYKLPYVAYVGQKGPNSHVEYINVYIRAKEEVKDSNITTTDDPQFVIGEGQATPEGTYPSVMNYSIRMRNQKRKAYDVNVHMETSLGEGKAIVTHKGISTANSSDFPFEINEANYDRNYEAVDTGEVIEVPYSMAIKRVTESAYYPLSYTVTYRTEPNGELYKETYSYMVRISNPAMDDPDAEQEKESTQEWNANTATKARLIVNSYRTEPEKVYAGNTFTLILELKNASENIQASNILLTFSSETGEDKSAIFSTDNGANSVVINSLAAGATAPVQMVYTAKAGADQGSYKITIKEKYDSPEYKNAEEEVSVDVPVYQYARLSTSSFEVMPSSLEVGSESNVMFGINNTGKVTLYNVAVKFKADSIRENNAYIGNIKPGTTGNVDVMLSAAAPTADDGKVTAEISYEDEYGNVSTVEKDFELFVSEPVEMDPDMMDPGMTEDMYGDGDEGGISGFFKKYMMYVLGGGAAAVILAAVLIKRHRKKKLEEESQADEDI
ncbi:MAG: CARDB domain-containing protein [Eubacteriales bacterium]|nr:CARDB domain-containing protein [Eubacteriales bacterium]